MNWYSVFRKIHTYIGMGLSIVLVGISVVGIMLRHPLWFGIDPSISSLNSGVFILGEKQVNLALLLDLVAIGLLYLTITGIGLWYYPKLAKRRKLNSKKLDVFKEQRVYNKTEQRGKVSNV
jgi:hypothetical protein